MFTTLRNAWKIPELRKKMLFTLLVLLIYRLGSCVPVPYVNTDLLVATFQARFGDTVLGLYNAMSGSAFSQATAFALGIQPYINASIIIELLCIAIPSLERLAKDGGEEGKKKIQKITRYTTIGLGLLMGFAYFVMLKNYSLLTQTGFLYGLVIVLTFTAGASFLMWMGEQIDQFGIGNGISMILFAGIISRIPTLITGLFSEKWYVAVLMVVGMLAIVMFIVFITNSERRIPVQYAKRVVGRKMYGGQSTNLPIKVNMSGVMPIIFASSIVNIPSMLGGIFSGKFWTNVTNAFNQTHASYIIISGVLLVAFSYFYIMISFNPVEVANNIKNNGGAIPGIRPGRPTIDFIKKVLNRVTFIGAVFLCLVSTLPMAANAIYMLFANTTTPNIIEYTRNSLVSELAFAGSSLLIITGVVIETTRSLDAQMSLRNYKGFLD